ncbi:MAG: hypothetical protein NVSMB28_00070 [Collimonas sp.]
MNMLRFAKIDGTGRVLFIGSVPESMLALQGDSIHVGDINGQTQYVVDGVATRRPVNPAKLVGSTLTDVPTGTVVTIGNSQYAVDDGRADLQFAYPGTYNLQLTCFPYLDTTIEITV